MNDSLARLNDRLDDAVIQNDVAQATSLIAQGATVNRSFPLGHAAGRGFLAMVELLLANDAEVNRDGDNSPDALSWAASSGHADIVARLIRAGANVHAGENQALRWAAQNGHKDAVNLLLDAGADVNGFRGAALRLAAASRQHGMISHLIERGADVRVALRHSVAARNECHVLKVLLPRDAAPDEDAFLAELADLASSSREPDQEEIAIIGAYRRERALLNGSYVSADAGHSLKRPGSGL